MRTDTAAMLSLVRCALLLFLAHATVRIPATTKHDATTATTTAATVTAASFTSFPLKITGMSLYDHSPRIWWKHFMPSFHLTHQEEMNNLTFQNTWNDGSVCQPRFFGVFSKDNTKQLDEFNDGGFGIIQLLHTKNNTYRQSSTVTCYYNTFFGTYMFTSPWIKETAHYQEHYVGISIFCPVFATKTKHTERNYCKLLRHKPSQLEIQLFPSYINASAVTLALLPSSPTSTPDTALLPPMSTQLQAVLSVEYGKVVLPVLKKDAASSAVPVAVIPDHSHTTTDGGGGGEREFVACTVQTFQNALSGPQLYLFATYYSSLGFQVVIYDRYGRHVEYIRGLVESHGVIYHPFTAYEITNPAKFTNETAQKEGSDFKVFYGRERKNKKVKVVSDTRQQDQDKMLTFDSARFHYSQYRLFLAVDADEILIPASSRGFALSGFKKELRGIFSKQALRDKEEFVFFRRSAAALIPSSSPDDLVSVTAAPDRLITALATCMQQGFTMSNASAIAACFGVPGHKDKFTKYIDTKSTCSFHYLHECCDRDRKSKELKRVQPMAITNKTWLVWSSSRCQCSKVRAFQERLILLHMNHNHFLTVGGNGNGGKGDKEASKVSPLALALAGRILRVNNE